VVQAECCGRAANSVMFGKRVERGQRCVFLGEGSEPTCVRVGFARSQQPERGPEVFGVHCLAGAYA
jgi:hypothetical protein